MGEAKPADPVSNEAHRNDPSPVLVAVGGDGASSPAPQANPREPERSGVSRGLFGVVLALLVLAIAGLALQTRHARGQAEQIGLLGDQVEGLQVQLSAANTQVATYDMQLTMVRAAVLGLFEQMESLQAIVSDNPFAPTPTAAPAPDPAPRAGFELPAELELPLVGP